ncbi:hypothetical protein Belba_0440 [Belliella baltica DSM 15883]|uniref:6-bladed beta-propeller n=1 Tax=Belliella baltica (strain DSM 15883 / CIP 108006 / LMG 21964 / BA134) TaxID=866536 RepID=I3Z1I1_BELBD|nr:6-bladed beta-propeller [Belliella baltica]AFL83099.1 hypothetical protein Belba_0440 [Belliella baltica DSM 15883]
MDNRFVIYILVFLWFSSSCNSSVEYDGAALSHFDISNASNKKSSDLEIVELVPLETTSENLMGMEFRVRINEDGFWVMNEDTKDAVHHFSLDGSYLGNNVVIGEGPNTLGNMFDFYPNPDGTLSVLSSIGQFSTIYSINKAGVTEKILEFEYPSSAFTKLNSENYLVYGGYNLPVITHRVIEVGNNNLTGRKFLENTYKNQMITMTERNFFKSTDELFVIESFDNIVKKYSNGNMISYLFVDFGKYNIPSKFWELDIMEGFEMINENGFASFHGVFADNENLLLSVFHQSREGVFKKLLFLNKPYDKGYSIEIRRDENNPFYQPIGIRDDRVLFITYRSILINYLKEKEESSTFLAKIPQNDFDYPVIVFSKTNF